MGFIYVCFCFVLLKSICLLYTSDAADDCFGSIGPPFLTPPERPARDTRVDPCIECTRSKLDTGQGVLGSVAPEDLLSACCLVLPLLLSALVSSCPFPSGLVPVGLQGLSWGSPLGPLLTSPGPCWLDGFYICVFLFCLIEKYLSLIHI